MGNSDPSEEKTIKRKKRRGAFPRVALKSVLELVDAIYELGHGDPVRRRTSLEHIGRSPDSSTSYVLISAANSGYELLKGGKNSPYFELKPYGLNIVEAQSSSDRHKAILDTLFANQYFAAIIEKYSDRPMPLDSIAIDFLQREHDLEKTDAESCWNTAKENIFDFNMYEDSGDKQVILAREHISVPESFESEEDKSEQSEGEIPHTKSDVSDKINPPSEKQVQQKRQKNSARDRVIPQITFNIQVVIPENSTPEVYDAIFESLANHLLRRYEDD